jgi:putative endonuclease
MFYVYFLYSSNSDRYYIGYTEDVVKRLKEHNHPVVKSKFTSKYLPWELKLSFEVSSVRGDAIRVERFIKKQKSKVFIQKLIAETNNILYFNTLINNILKKSLVRAIPGPRD